MLRPGVWMLAVLTVGIVSANPIPHINLAIDDLEGPGFAAKGLKASLRGTAEPELRLEIGAVTLHGRTWRDVRVRCPRLKLEASVIECATAVMEVGENIPLSFTYSASRKKLDVVLRPGPGEIWRLDADFGKREFRVVIANGKPERLASWLPAGLPKPGGGTLKGEITFRATGSVNAQIEVDGLNFSDASGLHAGEKVKAAFRITAEQRDDEWLWEASADWMAGEVFWQPVYATGSGQHLEAAGISSAQRTQVRRGNLRLPAVGSAEFNGVWDHGSGEIISADIRSSPLKLSALYAQILKPFLDRAAIYDVRAEGEVTAALQIARGRLNTADVQIKGVSMEDRGRRFALFGVDGHIPWQQGAATQARISVKGGELLRLPFGPFSLPLEMTGMHFAVARVEVPLFDPFGKVLRMQADLEMRNLDLDLLTRTFSFGNITGRVDAQVADLELANWQPVKFDARVASSPGEYSRKISQRAVQNISALGGAGAAAAIQRSFLGFFEQFGYQKLGLSCKLRNGVCEMSGAEEAPQGYVIVKGGGIPAITVIGYNRYVSWSELTGRLKRIIQDNVRAIVE